MTFFQERTSVPSAFYNIHFLFSFIHCQPLFAAVLMCLRNIAVSQRAITDRDKMSHRQHESYIYISLLQSTIILHSSFAVGKNRSLHTYFPFDLQGICRSLGQHPDNLMSQMRSQTNSSVTLWKPQSDWQLANGSEPHGSPGINICFNRC